MLCIPTLEVAVSRIEHRRRAVTHLQSYTHPPAMDADELSALPPEGSWKRSTRIRTTSLNPRYAYTNPSPATTRAESPFRPPGTSAAAFNNTDMCARISYVF